MNGAGIEEAKLLIDAYERDVNDYRAKVAEYFAGMGSGPGGSLNSNGYKLAINDLKAKVQMKVDCAVRMTAVDKQDQNIKNYAIGRLNNIKNSIS